MVITLGEADRTLLGRLGESLEDLLVVSGLRIEEGEELDVQVFAHGGAKCPRCWNHLGGHGQGEERDLCPRCWTVVGAETSV